jgi:hypothetical protein
MCVLLVLALDADMPRVVRFLAKLTFFLAATIIGASFLLVRLLGKKRTRLALMGITVFGLSMLATLLAAEFVTRIVFHDIGTTADNTSYFAERWRQTHPSNLNHWGFREKEFSLKPPSDTYRIAVVGDSFTYGQGISVKDRFSNILEQRLNGNGGRYEVLNFGRPGTETVDHVEILRDVVLDAEPNYVLLQWFINDVDGNSSDRPRPWRLIPSDTLSAFLHRHSALYYLVNQEWVKFQRRVGLIESYRAYMERRFQDPRSESSREARAVLNTFFQICKDRRIPVGVVLFPTLARNATGGYPFEFLMDRVLATCRTQEVTCLDLRDVYAAIPSPSSLWANRFDSHPGPLANSLAAEAMLKTFESVWARQSQRNITFLQSMDSTHELRLDAVVMSDGLSVEELN